MVKGDNFIEMQERNLGFVDVRVCQRMMKLRKEFPDHLRNFDREIADLNYIYAKKCFDLDSKYKGYEMKPPQYYLEALDLEFNSKKGIMAILLRKEEAYTTVMRADTKDYKFYKEFLIARDPFVATYGNNMIVFDKDQATLSVLIKSVMRALPTAESYPGSTKPGSSSGGTNTGGNSGGTNSGGNSGEVTPRPPTPTDIPSDLPKISLSADFYTKPGIGFTDNDRSWWDNSLIDLELWLEDEFPVQELKELISLLVAL
jgi:hypothetical protein